MIYIIMGPSGSGKTEAGEYLKRNGIKELVSHTTRSPRKGEIDGVSYHFVNQKTFEETEKIEENSYAGNLYGVSRAEVDNKSLNGDVFAVTDINGAEAFIRLYGDSVRIIYIHCSPGRLRKRMKARGDSREAVRKRLKNYVSTGESFHRYFADIVIDNNYSKRTLYKSLKYALVVLNTDRIY